MIRSGEKCPSVRCDQHVVGHGFEVEANGEESREAGVAVTASIEAEHELIEIGLQMRSAQTVIDAERPGLEVGKDPMDPGQDDVGSGLEAMQHWVQHELVSAFCDDTPVGVLREVCQQIEWPTEKPPAMVTIDDRAITFTGTWPSLDELTSFQPWYKKRKPTIHDLEKILDEGPSPVEILPSGEVRVHSAKSKDS